jgi:DNA helicase-2/ATP-dependent DNA helicase PcrA
LHHNQIGVPVKSSKSTLGTSGRYQLGQRVKHEKFGEGVVLQVEKEITLLLTLP